MRFRDRVALTVSPLLIRLGIAVVFIWAGSSKLFFDEEFAPEDAAILANLGMIGAPSKSSLEDSVQPAATNTSPETNPEESTASPESSSSAAPVPAIEDPSPDEGGAKDSNAASPTQTAPSEPEPTESVDERQHVKSSEATEKYSAADFPNSVRAVRAKATAVALYRASHPTEGRQLWPQELASPLILRVLTWCAALTEFLGGVLVLLGFLTRISALGLAGVMFVAMLLTTIGPAAGTADAFLGLLPPIRLGESGGGWVQAWQPWLFQLVLLLGAISLFVGGPGRISVDSIAFPARDKSGSSSTE